MDQREFARQLRRNMTDAEKLLWRHLRAHRLAGQKFRRQHPLGPYVVDFVHLGARVVVEADGGQHNGSVSDQARDTWLQAQGFRVLRFWNNDILIGTKAVLEEIWRAVIEAAPHPPCGHPLPACGERAGERGLTTDEQT
jgi:very-short-patch-repair endonuclease